MIERFLSVVHFTKQHQKSLLAILLQLHLYFYSIIPHFVLSEQLNRRTPSRVYKAEL